MSAILLMLNLGGGIPADALARTQTATRTPQRSPTPRPVPTATPAPNPAAGPGIMQLECRGATADSVRAFFLWNPSRSGPQWLDLSIFNDGFAPGRFVGVGGFPNAHWGFIWDGLRQGTTHYARINTLTSEGWKSGPVLEFFTPVCDAAAYEPPPAQDMLGLQARIAAAIQRSGINTAVAITDLQTGEVIDVNGYANRLPGCTINLFALMRVAVDLQFGVYPEPAAGDLIGQTINRSDPITSRRLVRDWIGAGDLYGGMTEVNELMQSLGMLDTLLDHPPAFFSESLNGGIDNRITARDSNRGLKAIWDGRVLAPAWRDYFLQKMTLVKPGLNYLIPAGVGNATVSHKNGFLYSEGWADNDVGIVWYERRGQRYGYAISFFTENVRNKYDDIPMGQEISSLAWQWFASRYGH